MKFQRILLILLGLALWAGTSQGATVNTYYNGAGAGQGTIRSAFLSHNIDNWNNCYVTKDTGTPSYVHMVMDFTIYGTSIDTGSSLDSGSIFLYTDTAPAESETIQIKELAVVPNIPSWRRSEEVVGTAWDDATVSNDAHSASPDTTAWVGVDVEVTTIGTTYEWDISAMLPATWDGVTKTYYFLIRSDDEGDTAQLNFRGGSVSANRPFLQVVSTDPTATPTPTDTFTPTPVQTATPTPTGGATPTPTPDMDMASEFGRRESNRHVVHHGKSVMEEGLAYIKDGVTDLTTAVTIFDRDNNYAGNFRNLIPGDFATAITGWTADPGASVVWDTVSAVNGNDSGSLEIDTVSASPEGASKTVNILISNTQKHTFSFSYKIASSMTIGMAVYYNHTSSSTEIAAVTSATLIWQRAALVFDATAGESVTAVEVYITTDPKEVYVDNLGLYAVEFDPGFVPMVFETTSLDSLDATTFGGFTEGDIITADSSGNLQGDNASLFYDVTAKKVGIGTSSPGYALDVVWGASNTIAEFTSSDDIVEIQLTDDNDTSYLGQSDTGAYLGFDTGGGVNGITVQSDGDLGIGTTAPQIDLQVANVAPRIGWDETDGTADNQLWDLGASADIFYGRLVDDAYSAASNWLTITRTLNDVDSLTLSTSGSSAADLVIDDDGDVGIGEAAPSAKLTVVDNIAGSNFVTTIQNDSGGGEFLSLISGDTGWPVFDFDSAGSGGEALLQMYEDNVQRVQISADRTSDNYFAVIAPSNFGIGTSGPSTKLDVVGQISASGGISTAVRSVGLATDTHNYDLTGNMGFLRISNSLGSSIDLTGIDEDDLEENDGFRMVIVNIDTADSIVLKHQDANSDAENRFEFSTGADITLAPDGTIEIIYDSVSGAWRDIN